MDEIGVIHKHLPKLEVSKVPREVNLCLQYQSHLPFLSNASEPARFLESSTYVLALTCRAANRDQGPARTQGLEHRGPTAM